MPTYILLGQPEDLEHTPTLSGPTIAELRVKWDSVDVQPAASFQGFIVECRDAQALGRGAIIAESRLIRRKAPELRQTVLNRQIGSLEDQLAFARAQFDVMSDVTPPHKVLGLASRLWQLQHRIDELAAEISRLQHWRRPMGEA
jgi:hypothetical protein